MSVESRESTDVFVAWSLKLEGEMVINVEGDLPGISEGRSREPIDYKFEALRPNSTFALQQEFWLIPDQTTLTCNLVLTLLSFTSISR
jgi:hypothetical protein